jgi:hypothetical protein
MKFSPHQAAMTAIVGAEGFSTVQHMVKRYVELHYRGVVHSHTEPGRLGVFCVTHTC